LKGSLPLFTPARLPPQDNPLHAIFYPSSVETGGAGIPVSITGAEPPRSIANGECGLRISAYTPAPDFSFMAFYGWTDIPWVNRELASNGSSTMMRLGPEFGRTLTLSTWSYLDLVDFDTANGVSAAYALTDSLSLSRGSDFFTGGIDDRGSYATYKDPSCMRIKGIFRF
jgi:hypothetical protein